VDVQRDRIHLEASAFELLSFFSPFEPRLVASQRHSKLLPLFRR
jgi:hypothetical protein